MPAKKSASVKKAVRGKRPVGLTSAVGPKVTTFLVICAIAGGLLIGAPQQSKPKLAAEATEGPQALRKTAEAAARQAVFLPFRIDKQPVKAKGLIRYRFYYAP